MTGCFNPSAGMQNNSIRMPARTSETDLSQGKGPPFLLGVIGLGPGHESHIVSLTYSLSLSRSLSASRRHTDPPPPSFVSPWHRPPPLRAPVCSCSSLRESSSAARVSWGPRCCPSCVEGAHRMTRIC